MGVGFLRVATHLDQIKGYDGGDDEEEYGPSSSSITGITNIIMALHEDNFVYPVATESASEPQVQMYHQTAGQEDSTETYKLVCMLFVFVI